eukprot:CAMPEP_0117445932 /NCGR_PEP_ID=MMETSP0759-20121206/6063_1 /TAXON_ID=63605 /ORGANISM="Percolomonas cosmopolitus, Strain WS" /LENGTH=556 /DNA_ID=CAMNT_0005238149 /DNA_START=233 /DNA_END=1906 /DNA_ORIENTATION=-
MSWGYATALDVPLLFEFQQVALPQRLNFHNDTEMIFSGSACVEVGEDDKEEIYLVYTGQWVGRQIQDQNLARMCMGDDGRIRSIEHLDDSETLCKEQCDAGANSPPAHMLQEQQTSSEITHSPPSYTTSSPTFQFLDNINPIIDEHMSDFRDPKMMQMPQYLREMTSLRHIMVLAVPLERRMRFYASKSHVTDKEAWHRLSEFVPEPGVLEGIVECPDLVYFGDRWSEQGINGKRIPVASTEAEDVHFDSDNSPAPSSPPYVLFFSIGTGYKYGSTVFYYVGTFNGTHFQSYHKQPRLVDHGPDFYAAVTFNNVPNGDILLQGWASNWIYANQVPTGEWRNMQSLARNVSLERSVNSKNGQADWHLVQQPVESLKRLRQLLLADYTNQLIAESEFHVTQGKYMDIECRLELLHEPVEIIMRSSPNERTVLGYDPKSRKLTLDRSLSGYLGYIPKDSELPLVFEATMDDNNTDPATLDVRIILDDGLVEVFANGGRITFSALIFPSIEESLGLTVHSSAPYMIGSMKVWGLDVMTKDTGTSAQDTRADRSQTIDIVD